MTKVDYTRGRITPKLNHFHRNDLTNTPEFFKYIFFFVLNRPPIYSYIKTRKK